jgi:hypothetical protein
VQTSRICDSLFYLHSDGWALQHVVMGVGTFIGQVHKIPQERNVVQMVLYLLLVVATLMKD